jgi:hypothetical protein
MREVKGYRLKHSIGSAHLQCLNSSYSFVYFGFECGQSVTPIHNYTNIVLSKQNNSIASINDPILMTVHLSIGTEIWSQASPGSTNFLMGNEFLSLMIFNRNLFSLQCVQGFKSEKCWIDLHSIKLWLKYLSINILN